jgi:hypothetical protein
LTIVFQFDDGSSNGFVFLYGAESEGPPREVADLVRASVRHTDLWHQNFKQATGRQNNP